MLLIIVLNFNVELFQSIFSWIELHPRATVHILLLGAAALRDIGYHFPDTDMRYKGISSMELLGCVAEKIAAAGYRVGNIDVTMIAQRPKLKDYIPQMRHNIAETLRVSEQQVNVKATTEEHLGFTGDGSGMSCHAVCLLEER